MVSIIIPSFNNLENLKKCIASIQAQEFADYEVWIVDNQSIDGTVEYLNSLHPPFNWISEKDNGVYEAMNKGISLASKEWLYFLGADDQIYNEKVLNTIFDEAVSDKYKLIIGSVKYDLKENDIVYTHTFEGLVRPSWSLKLWLKHAVHHQGIFYHKDVFRSKKYPVKYKILADHALNLALYKNNVKVKMVDEIIASCGTSGLSKDYSREMYDEEVRLKVDQSSVLLKPLFKIMAKIKYQIKVRKSYNKK